MAHELGALAALPEVACCVPSTHMGSSKPPITPTSGDLAPSSDLYKNLHIRGIHENRHTNKIKGFTYFYGLTSNSQNFKCSKGFTVFVFCNNCWYLFFKPYIYHRQ